MNELELYVDSLDPSLSNEEKVRLVQEWKKANRWNEQEVEVSEQVELEEVDLGTVKKKDGVAGADVPSEIAAPKDTDSQLENIFSELVVPEDELLKINEKVNSIDLNTSVQTKRTGGKFSQSFDVDIIPYEEQRIQAKKTLEEQGLELNEQAIQNQMRELIRQQEEDRYKAREHDKNAPGFFTLDTVKKIASTAGNIFSGSLRGESGLNKIIARTFYGEELDAIEKQYAKDSTEEAKAVNNLIDDSYFGVVKDVGSKILSPQYSQAKEIFENLSGEDVDKLALDIADKTDAYVEDLDKDIFKYKMGVTESFSDAIEQGDFSGYIRALTQATKEAAGSATYMAVAAVPGGLGIIGVSTAAGGEFKENSEGSKAYNELINLKITDPDYQSKKQELEEKIRNGQISLQNLAHHTVVGVTNSVFERWSGGLARNFFNTFKNQPIEVFEKNLKQYVLDFVKAIGGEGLTEATQTAIEKASNVGIQGKEVDFQEAMQEIYDAAIIGTVSAVGPSGTSNSINILRTSINNKKEKSLVKEAGVSNAVELFEGDIKPQGLDFTSIPNGSVRINAELDLQVSNGQKTTEEANAVKNRYREVQGAVNQLKPLDISIENQPAMVDLMIEQKNLQQKIKEVDNSSLTKAQSARLSEIDTELGDLITQDKSKKIDVGAKKIAEEIGVEFKSFNTQEDVDAAIATLQEQGGDIDTKNSDNYGTFVVLRDGRRVIILNKQTATEDRMFTEGQHETGHAVVYETVKNNPDAAIALGQSLLNELRTNKDINIKPEFQQRLDQYIQDADISQADTMEEVMTLVSDGLTNGTIEINETIGVKLGNFIRRALSAMGMKVKFKNGKDVLNFIKDYNRSVHRQQGLSKGLKKTAIEGAEVTITPEAVTETEIKESVAKESKRQVNPAEEAAGYQVAPLAAFLAADVKSGEKTNEQLIVDAAPKNEATPEVRIASQDALVEANWPVINKALKIDPSGKIPLPFIKLAVQEMFRDTFPGRGVKAKFFDKFDPKRKNKVTTFLESQLKDRTGDILERAKALESGKQDLGIEKAGGVIDTTVTETVKETAVKRPPSETGVYTPVVAENLDIDVLTEKVDQNGDRIPKTSAQIKTEVDAVINEAIKADTEGVTGVTRFGQVKVGPQLAAVLGKAFNLNPKVFLQKGFNLSGNFENLRQYLLKNAQEDFSNLPEAYDPSISGKNRASGAAFIPENVKNEFYKKVEGTNKFELDKSKTVKDYMNLLKESDGRSTGAQTVKGLSDLHFRNKIAEKLIKPSTRRVTGIKFSKRIKSQEGIETNEKLNNLFLKAIESKNKNQLGSILDYDSPAINAKNRSTLQANMLEAVKKYKLDTATIQAGMMASGGKQTFYGKEGGKMYSSAKMAKKAGVKDFIKFGKTTDGKFLPINTKGVDNWVAKPGRLYYGETDPVYKTLLKAAKKYDGPKPKKIIPSRAFSKNKKTRAQALQESKDNMEVLDHVVNQLADAVADDMPLEIAGFIITQSYQATGGLIKISAPFKYRSKVFRYGGPDSKKQQREGKKFREEHNPPASVVGAAIMFAIKSNAAGAIMQAVKSNYYQTQLSKFDDALLDKASLDANLVKGQTIFDNPISRLAAAGIDLQSLVSPFTGETIAQENGVGIDQDFYNGLNKDQKEQASAIQNDLIIKGLSDSDLDVKAMIDNLVPLSPGKTMASKRDSEMEPSSLSFNKFKPVQKVVNNLGKADEALNKGRRANPPVKKIRVFDFDDTLARSNSKVIVINPDANIDIDMLDIIARRKFKKEFENLPSYKQSYSSLNEQQKLEVLKETPGATTEINATQFAEQAADLEAQGATFDFSQFEQVIDGKKGPLFDVAKKIADTRGTEDLFVLTARPQSADGPIKEFMKALGIDIPLKNITGLGDGTAQAKARWIVDKAADGYNDFYFADDATKNVKAVKDVLSQLDVKSKVQQAKASKRKTFDTVVNDMIESSSGIESYKTFSAAKARTVGRDKGRFDWLTMASSAEDFKGLLYSLLGNGKKGEAQYEFLKTNLIDPYNKAEDAITQAKISAANDFMALKEQFPGLPTTLETETGVGKFTYQHALRTYMWTQQGMSIPGLSKADTRKLNKFITDDAKLQAFADQLMSIQKGKPYPKPGKDWLGGNLTTDIIGGINDVNRKEYQQEFRENVDIIFSPENLNKMEATYGTRWRKALENTLTRMKAGTNRLGYNDQTSAVLDWVNNSVGAVMFLNTRSALLQTISAVNFINWGDNNIIAAGKAFANQKQFWGDFMTLMNSDYLTQRRNGLKINVSESEIADAVKDSKNKVKAAIAFLLSKGFVLTRYADSFAIASGGATFYRNRMNKYVKEGMSQELAREKAFQDFRLVAEESQQSSSPDKISMQQASAAGRVILNWANTPMQYVRIQKRSIQDLIAGRGDAKTHISRIAYYGVVQNLIFNALQQALFAIGFGDDDDDEEKSAAKKKQDDKKIARVANGMIDSQLKGLGIAGMGMVAAKNSLMKIYEESGKNRSEYEKAAIEALSFSPAISSKYRKIVGGLKSFSWNMKEIKEKGFSLDNPAYLAGAQIITATTNIPIDRVIKKANNIRGIMSEQSQMWQKVSMALGWSSYDVGLPYYGGWDKPVEPTPAERKKQEIDVMKKDTSTADQTQMLLDLGLDKKQIKALRYEDARVKKIIELQNKKKDDKNKP